MMKKLLTFFAAAAVLMSACTQEKLENPAAGQEVNVTLSVQIPDNIATKAEYSDGTKATQLSYAVYDSNSKEPLFDKNVTITGGVANITDLVLITGKTYDLLFWAQSPKNTAYSVSLKEQTMTVDYDKLLANDDNNDAFYAFETFTVTGAINRTVNLYRPFAQVNLGTDDLAASQDESFKLGQTAMTAKVANVLNFVDGTVTGDAVFPFAANDVPNLKEDGTIDPDNKDGEFPVKGYNTYLAMNYLLVGAEQTTTNCEFKIYEQGKENETNTITVTNVPVRRNYRTNIYGSLLTDPANIQVVIVPTITDLENVEVVEVDETVNDDEFYTILQRGGNVVLTGGRDEIDFRNRTIAKDLTLTLEAPVGKIYLGGNNAAETKAEAGIPNVTIVLSKDVDYPVFYANYSDTKRAIVNYTLAADPASSKVCEQNIQFSSLENVTFDGFNFGVKGGVYAKTFNGLTVKNCLTSADYNAFFLRVYAGSGLTVQNNTITAVNYDHVSGAQNNDIFVVNGVGGNILFEGNSIDKSLNHHAIWIANSPEAVVMIKGNTISNTLEDAVKIDQPGNVTVMDNNISNAGVNGIRFDNFANDATLTVTGNTISTNANSALATGYGIYLKKGTVNVNLTASKNVVGKNGIAGNLYFKAAETLTLSGNHEFPFVDNVAEGVSFGADGKTFAISSLAGFKWFAEQSNASARHELVKAGFAGQTVKLMADIDLNNVAWTPIGSAKRFDGVFDGGEHTVKNLTVNAEKQAFAGLFANVVGTVKNVKLANVNVSGNYNAAALVASIYGTVENCHVDGGTVISTPHKVNGKNDDGNNAGGLVGHLCEGTNYIRNCSVKNLKVTAYRDVAGLVGKVNNGSNVVAGNTVENVVVTANQLVEYGDVKAANAGEIVGRNMPLESGASLDLTTNTASNVKVNVLAPNEEGTVTLGAVELSAIQAISSPEVKEVVMTEDIQGSAEGSNGYNVTGVAQTNGGIFDGGGNTLTVNDSYATWASAFYTKGGTVKNLNIDGGFRGIFIAYETSKVVIDNVTINPIAYTFSVDGANGHGLEVKNSTLNGWTSYAAAIGNVSFYNCKFGSNGSYAFMRPYAVSVLEDCTFSEGFEFDARQSSSITFKNCYVGETLITPENVASLFHTDSLGLDKIIFE